MAETAHLAWYRQGLVSATDGSTKVLGNGTKFLTAGINQGAAFRIDSRPYAWEIKSVVSDTELELATPYYGGTVSNASYSIDRNHQSTLPADLSARLAKAMGNWEARYDLDMQRITGKSAYEVAVENGYKGTQAEWLESLKGAGEITALQKKIEPVTYNNAYAHNSVYRGKNLGTALTAEQSAAIRNGTFEDIYPGDYWSIAVPAYSWTDSDGEVHNETGSGASALLWRVMGLDYFYKNYAQNQFTSHHAVIVPLTTGFLPSRAMNATETTASGYAGSDMFTKHLKQMEELLKATFGDDHLLRYSMSVCNAVTDDKESGWITVSNRICDLLTRSMVCVSKPNALFTPLPGFFFNKHEISGGWAHAWLQDAYDSKDFYVLAAWGGIDRHPANDPQGYGYIRPFFLLH